MENETISLIAIIAGIIMSAYFSATETAFSSLNSILIKKWNKQELRKPAW